MNNSKLDIKPISSSRELTKNELGACEIALDLLQFCGILFAKFDVR